MVRTIAGPAGADHLRDKLAKAGDRVKTIDDFTHRNCQQELSLRQTLPDEIRRWPHAAHRQLDESAPGRDAEEQTVNVNSLVQPTASDGFAATDGSRDVNTLPVASPFNGLRARPAVRMPAVRALSQRPPAWRPERLGLHGDGEWTGFWPARIFKTSMPRSTAPAGQGASPRTTFQ